jgi:hypothetical protein
MTRLYLFADEAGVFEFARRANVSRYFILCTVTMTSCAIGHVLLDLRRHLAWERAPLGECFHATTDKQVVRDTVFAELCLRDGQGKRRDRARPPDYARSAILSPRR